MKRKNEAERVKNKEKKKKKGSCEDLARVYRQAPASFEVLVYSACVRSLRLNAYYTLKKNASQSRERLG